MADDKSSVVHVESHEDDIDIVKGPELAKATEDFHGDVGLAGPDGVIYLIPTPSPDPRDPLNLPLYRKYVLVMCVAVFSTVGLTMVSGLGGILGIYITQYTEASYADITALMTYPTLFMGIGNLIGMPLALAIGRRPVFLASTLVILLSGTLCATQRSYTWHLAARCILGLAAGQSEALCPLMVQETFFMHERARTQMYFTAFSNILTSVLTLLTSYISAKTGPAGWYGLCTGLAGVVGVVSLLGAVPETKYERPLGAYQGQSVSCFARRGEDEVEVDERDDNRYYITRRISTVEPRELDTVNYKPRTLASDMRLFVNKPDWQEGIRTVKRMAVVMFFPDIFWAFLLNGLTLGVNVALGTTYSAILSAAPYSWPAENISLAMAGQIIVSFVGLPLLGIGSDWLVRTLAKRNGGVHQPQYRLVPLVLPVIVGTLSAIIYGQAAAHPERFHWFAIVFTINAYYFAFVGANQCGIVYALDSYPTRSGPALVIICAMRGVLSFGTSYAVTPFINSHGYDGAFLTYGILTAVLGGFGVVVYFFSQQIRTFCSRWAVPTSTTKPTYS